MHSPLYYILIHFANFVKYKNDSMALPTSEKNERIECATISSNFFCGKCKNLYVRATVGLVAVALYTI